MRLWYRATDSHGRREVVIVQARYVTHVPHMGEEDAVKFLV